MPGSTESPETAKAREALARTCDSGHEARQWLERAGRLEEAEEVSTHLIFLEELHEKLKTEGLH